MTSLIGIPACLQSEFSLNSRWYKKVAHVTWGGRADLADNRSDVIGRGFPPVKAHTVSWMPRTSSAGLFCR